MISSQPQSAAPSIVNPAEVDGAPAAEPAPPPVTYILLIRHGENEWVTSGKLAGRTPGVHLNERGRQQSVQVADYLAKQPISAIYSSPLERCMESAAPLAERLDMPITEEPGIIEVDYGDWLGIELKTAAQKPEWVMVQHFPSVFRFPDGETLREAQHRAVATIERLVADHPNQVIALFSHGDVIRTVLAHFAGVPIDLFQRLQIGTASMSTLGFFGSRPAIINLNVQAEPSIIKFKHEAPPESTAGQADASSNGAQADSAHSNSTSE